MRFRILGPLEVWSAEEGWTAIGAPKWRSLLACLLVRPGQLVSTESLILELWGDSPPAKANNLVSIYVHRLRRLIGDTEGRMLVYRAPGYLLRVAPGDLDLQDFERLAADGRSALAAADPERAAALFAEALGLWRGLMLADVAPSALIGAEGDRANELRLDAAELHAEAALACGRSAQLVPELRRLVADHPIREGLWLLLMRALDEAGRHAEALETYTQARQVIADELGVDPGAELQQLYARLLAADASSAQPRKRPRQPGAPPGRVAGAAPGRSPGAAPGARPGDAGAAAAAGAVDAGAPGDGGAEPGADEAVPGPEKARVPAGEASGTISVGTVSAATGVAEASAGPPVPGPAQLPADIGDFTGRESQVRYLCGMLAQDETASSPGAVRIAVVAGAAGLGKTALAVHAAHRVSTAFPDGQLYVDLFGATARPAAPGEVLARFLRDLGVEGDKVPVGDDERAALYRTRLTGHRMLILLDNARDAAQVRPLLPGSAACAVLVTTRNRTPDLASTRFVDLNVLEDAEALTLFSRIVDDDRPAAEPDATAEVLLACAGLPLAIRICAARLAARRQWRIATLANRLRNEQRRLDELETGDLAVRSSFQVSYDSLLAGRHRINPARAFRLLGLWQGASISLPAAAALLGEPEDDVADALETLVDANLLESPAPDRYRFHDLLRFYATERAQEEESAETRDDVVRRLLRWYLGTASAAADIVAPHRYRLASAAADNGPEPAREFGTVEEALAWYDAERANVVSATRQAAACALHDVAWRLPPTLFPVFNRRSNWADAVVTLRVALDSARTAGDRPGEAWVLNQLGFSLARMRDEESFGCLEQALGIRRQLGDAPGEAQTAIALGEGYLKLHGPAAALDYFKRAADLLRPTGQTSLHGVALNNLGEVYLDLGDLGAAADCFEKAHGIFTGINAEYGLGFALHNLGRVYLDLGRPDDAVDRLQRALAVHRSTGDHLSQALTLKYLGRADQALSRLEKAREEWTAALAIFESLKEDAEIADINSALASLGS
jgi:DNA-binding SARP family transcriptional activator/Tfp pilus assembly protein PilF